MPIIDKDKKISPDVLILISEDVAKYYKMVPLSLSGNVLDVGLVNQDDVKAQEALNFLASRNGLVARVFKISESDWLVLMKQYTGLGEEVGEALEGLRKELEVEKEKIPIIEALKIQKDQVAPVIRMVDTILR